MPDVYSRITEIDPQTQERLIDVLEMRASDSQQRRMWETYLSGIEFPPPHRSRKLAVEQELLAGFWHNGQVSHEYLALIHHLHSLPGHVHSPKDCLTFRLNKVMDVPCL